MLRSLWGLIKNNQQTKKRSKEWNMEKSNQWKNPTNRFYLLHLFYIAHWLLPCIEAMLRTEHNTSDPKRLMQKMPLLEHRRLQGRPTSGQFMKRCKSMSKYPNMLNIIKSPFSGLAQHSQHWKHWQPKFQSLVHPVQMVHAGHMVTAGQCNGPRNNARGVKKNRSFRLELAFWSTTAA